MVCVIVNHGLGSKVVNIAKHYGVVSGKIMHGIGTANNKILDYLGLSDIRREVVFMFATPEVSAVALEGLNKELKFAKPNHGIAYSVPVTDIIGSRKLLHTNSNTQTEGETNMYQSIMVIVEKGRAEEVIDAAAAAGSKGGTIINARGSGIHETSKVFAMEIEPEKEIVLILSEFDATDAIVDSIRKNLNIDVPGNGVIYIQPVNKTYGILK
ncbi:MAG: P-II family nitrogen regulator [Clostridiales bacterium]|nr:P-II family nitrogen regulator [Clostridiales bacterium]